MNAAESPYKIVGKDGEPQWGTEPQDRDEPGGLHWALDTSFSFLFTNAVNKHSNNDTSVLSGVSAHQDDIDIFSQG